MENNEILMSRVYFYRNEDNISHKGPINSN